MPQSVAFSTQFMAFSGPASLKLRLSTHLRAFWVGLEGFHSRVAQRKTESWKLRHLWASVGGASATLKLLKTNSIRLLVPRIEVGGELSALKQSASWGLNAVFLQGARRASSSICRRRGAFDRWSVCARFARSSADGGNWCR